MTDELSQRPQLCTHISTKSVSCIAVLCSEVGEGQARTEIQYPTPDNIVAQLLETAFSRWNLNKSEGNDVE